MDNTFPDIGPRRTHLVNEEKKFTCVIEDPYHSEKFSAKVSIHKKVRPSLQVGRIDLADIFITPVSGTFFYYTEYGWEKEQATFNVPTKENRGTHNHFVVHDSEGHGIYIVRDQYRREIDRRRCSIWDLGRSFAIQVRSALQDLP
jgi:hypothetical protein